MKPKTMILMVVAVGCGLGASYMTSKLLAERKQAPQEEKVSVLVSKTKVPKYTILKEPEKFFAPKEFSRSSAPKSYFTDLAQIKDKKVNKDLKADVHISAEDLADKSTAALDVPPGYGAISIKVTAAQMVSGFIYPGDKVDLILTRRGENASALTILREVLVLAVGDRPIRPEDAGAALQANTVTVALKSEEGQLVTLAETLGELRLLLRKEGDATQQTSKVTTVNDLLRSAGVNPSRDVVASTPKEDGDKLPFGLDLPAIEKNAKKGGAADAEPEEPEAAAARPDWTITIYPGFDPPVRAHYFKREDGDVTRDDGSDEGAPGRPEKKDKKDAKKPGKK